MKLLQTKSLYYHKKKLIKIEIKENLLNMYLYTLKNTIFERVKTIYQTLMFGKMFKKIDKKIVPWNFLIIFSKIKKKNLLLSFWENTWYLLYCV